jgi:hypothetical protein
MGMTRYDAREAQRRDEKDRERQASPHWERCTECHGWTHDQSGEWLADFLPFCDDCDPIEWLRQNAHRDLAKEAMDELYYMDEQEIIDEVFAYE